MPMLSFIIFFVYFGFFYPFIGLESKPVYPDWRANNKKDVPVHIVQIKPADKDLIIEFGVCRCNKERKKKPTAA